MGLSALNPVAAALILKDSDRNTRVEGVVASAVVPGVLGLAVPLVLRQKQRASLTSTAVALPGRAQVAIPAQPNVVVVPDVTNDTLADAVNKLTADNLKYERIDALSAEVVKDEVAAQHPRPGATVPVGSIVRLTVSVGPAIAQAVTDVDARLKQIDSDLQDVKSGLEGVKGELDTKLEDVKDDLDTKLDAILRLLRNRGAREDETRDTPSPGSVA
jgi:hypothetical protein